MEDKITVHVSFSGMNYDQQYAPGTTVKDFAYKFLEDNMLDDGCFININGENMTRHLDYVLQDEDNIVVLPMVLSGG